MDLDIELLSNVMTGIAIISSLLFIFLKLYFAVRRKFPKTVNCWFCNVNKSVPYNERNSWTCTFCQQYNGFTSTGDYNKLIPAQHDELLNVQLPIKCKNVRSPKNGLCSVCNNNQQLKIHQLANFIPLKENNYDIEIEHFQKQLDRAYKLCPRCDEVLKHTIHKQNTWILGLKLLQNRINKTSLPSLQQSTAYIFSMHFLHRLIVSVTVLQIIFIASSVNYSNESVSDIIPNYLQPYVVAARDLFIFFFNSFQILLSYTIFSAPYICIRQIASEINSSNYTILFLSMCGLILQVANVLLRKPVKRKAMYSLVARTILVFLTWNDENLPYLFKLQICTILFVIAAESSRNNQTTSKVYLQKIKNSTTDNKYQSKDFNQENNLSVSADTSFASFEETLRSSTPDYKSNRGFSPINDTDIGCKPQQYIFGQAAVFENVLNNSPTSFGDLNCIKPLLNAGATSLTENVSLYSFNTCIETDLNKSLNQLHLGVGKSTNFNGNATIRPIFNGDIPRPRPLLSPARLKNITQNSWLAGGYWKADGELAAETFSRSSSQSSGYGSQMFNSLPSSRNNSICGEIDRFSILSEPAYSTNHNPNVFQHNNQHLTVYPTLRHDSQVFIQPKYYRDDVFHSYVPHKSPFVEYRPWSEHNRFKPWIQKD